MKKLLVATLVLMANVAVGQNPYQIKNKQGFTTDITTMTNTVNAWKSMPITCTLGSLIVIGNSQWCVVGHSAYEFDTIKRQWVQQPQFGSALIAIAGFDPANLYSLQTVGHCGVYGGVQYYGVFRWIGSWSEDANLPCLSHLDAADSDFLAGIGFDSSANQSALFYSSSNPGGTWPNVSWTLQSGTDGLISVQMDRRGVGCSVDANGGIWQIYSNAAPQQLPALPSGANRAVGCLYAENPSVAMAWTTTSGSVYTMPLENWGTWQQVTGIASVGMTGLNRHFLFGQDLSGNPYHWNTNAPGMSATYGGQWNTQDGCPAPSSPCHTNVTHTVKHRIWFTSGHGLHGSQGASTQVFTNDIEVPADDISPGCDPLFGPPADPECRISLAAEAHCNQSNQDVGNFSLNWVVGDSIEVLDYDYNLSSGGPMAVYAGNQTGYYLGQTGNQTHDGCLVSDPTPVCSVDTSEPFIIFEKVAWYGSLYQDAALARWQKQHSDDVSGRSAPYVTHGFYIAQELPDGTVVNEQCFGTGWIGEGDLLYGNKDAAPACK